MPALPEPKPELDMQAVGWAIADSEDYIAPLIQEWFQLKLEGFPLHLKQAPPNPAWDAGWIAQHEQMALNPLDGISLYMLFQQPQPQVLEEEYFWDPEPVWQFPVDSPEPLQGYAVPEHMTHLAEDDLVQEETRVLRECFFPSTVNRLVNLVADPAYDPQQAGTSSNPSNQRNDPIAFPRTIPLEVPSMDPTQKQLKRVLAAISLWGLICSSCEHRQKLCHTLTHLEVQADVTPEAMVSLILPPTAKHTVVFTDKDLPIERTDHNRPLHITVKYRRLWVPTVLIDNGSAINVCPMRVAYRLGLAKKDLALSNLAVKAYDSTRRMVEGTLMLKLDAEGFEMDVEFHVVDVPATFNLLLGRPWLHRSYIMAIP
ncbi:hypothetical protein RHMOL_Rhmol07G0196500 [Rhododendron molle]|uniref:Uncharacterized protein n=1 Tax=Rhododendron molle TaxID=49168 RepID=A0ACC0N4I8_RHOML|nr:hypothetical protein RHMOL_Rhmol07G0196500 [Rhododendron molle]